MGKRRGGSDESGSENGEDTEVCSVYKQQKTAAEETERKMIDVDFDFCALKELDFHAIKLLISQLLSKDASLVDVSGLADYLIKQDGVGTVVKTDGDEGDPFAITSIVPLDDPALSSVKQYITQAMALPEGAKVGLVVSSRLINMPPQVAFPCYRLLVDEEVAEGTYTHALVLGRVFRSTEEELERDPNAHLEADDPAAKGAAIKPKKAKKSKREKQSEQQVWAYQPEDDLLASVRQLTAHRETFSDHRHKQHAVSKEIFAYRSASSTTAEAEAGERLDDAFGVDSMGQLILLEWPAFERAVREMEAFLGAPAA